MSTTALPTFFMRFYGAAVANIEACVAEMRARFPQIVGHRVVPLTHSVNVVVPSGSMQVDLDFQNEADRDAVQAHADGVAIYMRHAQAADAHAEYVGLKTNDVSYRPAVAAAPTTRRRARP